MESKIGRAKSKLFLRVYVCNGYGYGYGASAAVAGVLAVCILYPISAGVCGVNMNMNCNAACEPALYYCVCILFGVLPFHFNKLL